MIKILLSAKFRFQTLLWKLKFRKVSLTTNETEICDFRNVLSQFPLLPYEKLGSASSKTLIAFADQIIETGWSRSNYPIVNIIDGPIPWEESSKHDRSWSYFLHCWDMLNALLVSYSDTQNRKYLIPALEVALEWISKYPIPPAPSSFAWYDMAVGMRSFRLAYILDAAARVPDIEDDKIAQLLKSLLVHREYLADDANISFHSNHGFFQIAGEIALSRRLIFLPGMSTTYKQASNRFQRIIDMQFSKEGVHLEHSPDYHRLVYSTIKNILDSGIIVEPSVKTGIRRFEENLEWFIKPNDYLVNFGDSDQRMMASDDTGGANSKRRSPRRLFGGGTISFLHKSHCVFKESGYFIVKKRVTEIDSFREQSYLAQIACYHSRTHKHADDLSIVWYERGNDILIDSGKYGFIGKVETGSKLWKEGYWYSDPSRIYVESTRAHNTVEIDGRDYLRKGRKPYGSAIEKAGEKSGIFFSEAHVRHFSTMRHRRFLFFNPGQWLFVLDWLWDNKEQSHDYRQWFHFSPDIEVVREDNQYHALIPGVSTPLRIASFLNAPDLSGVYQGATEPLFQGWWSPKEKILEPSPTVAFEKKGVRNTIFGTLFIFSDHLIPDVVSSQAHELGRNADLFWRTDTKQYRLMFKSPPDLGLFWLSYHEKPAEYHPPR